MHISSCEKKQRTKSQLSINAVIYTSIENMIFEINPVYCKPLNTINS